MPSTSDWLQKATFVSVVKIMFCKWLNLIVHAKLNLIVPLKSHNYYQGLSSSFLQKGNYINGVHV